MKNVREIHNKIFKSVAKVKKDVLQTQQQPKK